MKTVSALLSPFSKTTTCLLLVMYTLHAAAESFDWAPAQPIGSTFPDIILTAPSGEKRALIEFAGENGTLLFFNRSTDW